MYEYVYVHTCTCPCCLSMVHVYAACPCCMSWLHFHAACQGQMSMPHVHAACPCRVFPLHVHAAYPCCLCPYCMSTWRCMDLKAASCCFSMRYVYTTCKCCLQMLHFPAACSFCMSMSMLHVHVACIWNANLHFLAECPCHMSKSRDWRKFAEISAEWNYRSISFWRNFVSAKYFNREEPYAELVQAPYKAQFLTELWRRRGISSSHSPGLQNVIGK